MKDPWETPEMRRWKARAQHQLVPKIEASGVCLSIAPPDGKVDIKFAVELGLMIMLDKPIIVVSSDGRPVPPKLAAIADHVIYSDIETDEGRREIADALKSLTDEQTDHPE